MGLLLPRQSIYTKYLSARYIGFKGLFLKIKIEIHLHVILILYISQTLQC